MCQRPERDERGRLRPGSTANPNGRPPVSRYGELLRAASKLGAAVVILPQTQAAAVVVEDVDPVPPRAA